MTPHARLPAQPAPSKPLTGTGTATITLSPILLEKVAAAPSVSFRLALQPAA